MPKRRSKSVAWLNEREVEDWLEVVTFLTRLPSLLDTQLRRDADLTHFEYGILAQLSSAPDRTIRMAQLAEFAAASPSRLSHVVTRLVQRGFAVKTAVRGEPGRATDLTLTDAGYAKLVEAAPGHVSEVRRQFLDRLQPGELEAIASLLRRVRLSEDTAAEAEEQAAR